MKTYLGLFALWCVLSFLLMFFLGFIAFPFRLLFSLAVMYPIWKLAIARRDIAKAKAEEQTHADNMERGKERDVEKQS